MGAGGKPAPCANSVTSHAPSQEQQQQGAQQMAMLQGHMMHMMAGTVPHGACLVQPGMPVGLPHQAVFGGSPMHFLPGMPAQWMVPPGFPQHGVPPPPSMPPPPFGMAYVPQTIGMQPGQQPPPPTMPPPS